ncbi:MAG: hypothetical protein DHS80DRAFT_8518, partial [Piptocephalis tieghemiana]
SGYLRRRRSDSFGFGSNEMGPFFTATKQLHTVTTTDHSVNLALRVHVKVDRGFFIADGEWTCYRRNYFQLSAAFGMTPTHSTLSAPEPDASYLVDIDGVWLPITQFTLGITARVSTGEKSVDLVQHTPKRDKGPQTVPMPKPIRPGGNVSLCTVGTNHSIVSFERVQFKVATANNGKRRAAQQYYVLVVDVYAECQNGQAYQVATCHSAPLVVRGRSPGHYADHYERL